ncbi:hypothetical protein HPB51_006559 [Rhipicephalus microplus]|uniref:Uncharacterized protein n=1 Tax=Rhipicephalus microplus TaxID=6941 RepID=A0A9J6E6M2_RHIMP|nr:hypothetical protein HPB51_006559 [Rhipicephalus microplus]
MLPLCLSPYQKRLLPNPSRTTATHLQNVKTTSLQRRLPSLRLLAPRRHLKVRADVLPGALESARNATTSREVLLAFLPPRQRQPCHLQHPDATAMEVQAEGEDSDPATHELSEWTALIRAYRGEQPSPQTQVLPSHTFSVPAKTNGSPVGAPADAALASFKLSYHAQQEQLRVAQAVALRRKQLPLLPLSTKEPFSDQEEDSP